MNKIAAIDLGQKGCLCLFNRITNEIQLEDLRLLSDKSLDSGWLLLTLSEWEAELVVIENVFKPKTLIIMAGEVSAISKIIDAELKVVHPKTWMKAMLGEPKSDKEKSIRLCKKLRPEVNLIRKKVRVEEESHDRAESVLLALYATKII